MSMPSFTRTLLTTSRFRTVTSIPNPVATALYRPLFTPRFFSYTSRMSETKEGVHNLVS